MKRKVSRETIVALCWRRRPRLFPDLLFHLHARSSRRKLTRSFALVGRQAFTAAPRRRQLDGASCEGSSLDPEVLGDLHDSLAPRSRASSNGATAELRRVGTWHSDSFSRRASPSSGQVSVKTAAAQVVHMRIFEASLQRSLLVLQAVVNEAERRYYKIGVHKSYGCEGGFGIIINGHGFEITVKEERDGLNTCFLLQSYTTEHGGYFYAPNWDFLPTGRLQLCHNHDSYGPSLANDRQRWKVEDRLQGVLTKLEDKAAAAEAHRVEQEIKRVEAQDAWEVAMDHARGQYAGIHCRVQELTYQLQDRQTFREVLAFVSEVRAQPSLSDEDRLWLDWVARHAASIDPLRKPLAPPPVPEPSPKELEPFLGGLSPYGPSHW